MKKYFNYFYSKNLFIIYLFILFEFINKITIKKNKIFI